MNSGALALRSALASRTFRFAAPTVAVVAAFAAVLPPSPARPTASKTAAKRAVVKTKATAGHASKRRAHKPLPRYLPLKEIKYWQAARSNLGWYGLDPLLNGKPLPASMTTIPGALTMQLPAQRSAPLLPRLKSKVTRVRANAQRFPRPIPPARVRRAAAPVVPRWVRYPLEFQLAGIGIGTRAVDKDRFNRIDRYGLFAMHGNPTAVVVATAGGGGVSIQQQPPEVSALFPASRDGAIPDWAAAITVQLDNNHVEWLYKRDTYAMGFIVDRLGFVDAIVVAGVQSPIARTQLEDPVHTVKLGDDLRKVFFRYGYPDTIETYTTAVAGVGTGGGGGGAAEGGSGGSGGGYPGGGGSSGGGSSSGGSGGYPGGGGSSGGSGGYPGGGGSSSGGSSSGGSGGYPGGGGGGASAGGGGEGNNAYRTFEVRYEQSYNIVFTIRNNRVVRIYIFGDPDFFNDRRRRQFRVAY